jgi:hypothetical protein
MMNLTSYLKLLSKIDYPNQTESLSSISKAVDYSPYLFNENLLETLGVIGVDDFVGKTFSKMGVMSKPGYKIDLDDVGEDGSYIYLIIDSYEIIENNEEGYFPFEVWINYSWGDNQLIHDGTGLTLDEIYDEVGLGEVGEYDELLDNIMDNVSYKVYAQTGFHIHFDSQI